MLVDHLDGPAWAIDRGHRLLVGNVRFMDQLARAFGRRPVVGEDLLAFSLSDAVRTKWRQLYERALSGSDFDVDAPQEVLPEQRLIEYRFRCVRRAARVVGVCVYGFDVTETRRRELELHLQAHILASLSEGVSLTRDSDGCIAYANPAFERMFGYAAGELVGQPVSLLNAPEVPTPQEVAHSIMETLRSSGVWEGEIQNVRKDGTSFWSQAAVSGSDHPTWGRVWVSRHVDITEQKRHRELQAHMLETQKLESLGVLAGGIAHDINNLLVPIVSYSELIREDAWNPVAVRAGAEYVAQAAGHIRDLVLQMLAYAGKGHLVTQPVRLDSLLHELIPLLRSSLAKNVRLELQYSPDVPEVEGEPAQLRQVLMNLILNASEAMAGRAGTIRVGLRRWSPRDVPALPEGTESGAIVEVEDDGPGIAAAILGRVFDPFFTTKQSGRGLGLSAVQGIVRAHHGKLELRTVEGRGTLFTIALPARAESSAGQGPSREDAARTVAKCILVVDDEPGVLSSLRAVLERAGYSVVGVSSGEACLAILDARDPTISAVLLDLTLKGWSGEETFRRLRAAGHRVPVLLMSGWNAGETLAADVRSDLAAVLAKPFTPSELRRVLGSVLAG
jgi:PAS domain S-box-containing protein